MGSILVMDSMSGQALQSSQNAGLGARSDLTATWSSTPTLRSENLENDISSSVVTHIINTLYTNDPTDPPQHVAMLSARDVLVLLHSRIMRRYNRHVSRMLSNIHEREGCVMVHDWLLAIQEHVRSRAWKQGTHVSDLCSTRDLYRMTAELQRAVPLHAATWIQCFIDLLQYRMSLETNPSAREYLSHVYRRWCTRAKQLQEEHDSAGPGMLRGQVVHSGIRALTNKQVKDLESDLSITARVDLWHVEPHRAGLVASGLVYYGAVTAEQIHRIATCMGNGNEIVIPMPRIQDTEHAEAPSRQLQENIDVTSSPPAKATKLSKKSQKRSQDRENNVRYECPKCLKSFSREDNRGRHAREYCSANNATANDVVERLEEPPLKSRKRKADWISLSNNPAERLDLASHRGLRADTLINTSQPHDPQQSAPVAIQYGQHPANLDFTHTLPALDEDNLGRSVSSTTPNSETTPGVPLHDAERSVAISSAYNEILGSLDQDLWTEFPVYDPEVLSYNMPSKDDNLWQDL